MIAKEDIESIFEALYDQIVVSFEADKLSVDDYETIVENYKCVYKEFNDKRKLDNITREEIQDEFEKFYQSIEQKLLYDEPSIISTKKEDVDNTSMMLSHNDSVLYKASTGLAAKEKLIKALMASNSTEAQKATARTVIDNIVDKFTCEIQRLQDIMEGYESRIQHDKKAIKSESETIAEFARENEKKEAKIVELARETRLHKQQYDSLKESTDRSKKLWDVEKADLVPRLEKEQIENRDNQQRIDQQIHIIAELEHQNTELKDLAEKRYKSFVQLQEQQRSERADQVAFMKLQTECEGLRKKLVDLEDFIQKEETEYLAKVEQLSLMNDNLVEECKGYKKKIKELEEEKWRMNMNAGLNENMFDNSFVKESMMKMGHEDLLNKSKLANTSFNMSPVHRQNRNSSMVQDLALELVDMEKRSFVIDDSKMKPILRNITTDHNKSLQILENDALSSDNEINLTLEDFKQKNLAGTKRVDFGSQTNNELPDLDLPIIMQEMSRVKHTLSMTDLPIKSQLKTIVAAGVDIGVQLDDMVREDIASQTIEETKEDKIPIHIKAETSIFDIEAFINHQKKMRQLKIYGYTAFVLNSKAPILIESDAQTDATNELSFIDSGKRSPGAENISYFDASQAFIENLDMIDKKSRCTSPVKAYRPPLVRSITGPLVLFDLPHATKEYLITNALDSQDYGVYYMNAASQQQTLSPPNNTLNTSMFTKRTPLDTEFVRILNYASEKKSARKTLNTQQNEMFKRESVRTLDTYANTEDLDTNTLNELRSHIVSLVDSHQKEISQLHDNYNLRIQSLLNNQSDKVGPLVVQNVTQFSKAKVPGHDASQQADKFKNVNNVQTAVFSLNAHKTAKILDVNPQSTIVSQDSNKGVLTISEPSHVLTKLSDNDNQIKDVQYTGIEVDTYKVHAEENIINTQRIQDINTPTTIISQNVNKYELQISDPSHIYAQQVGVQEEALPREAYDLQTNVFTLQSHKVPKILDVNTHATIVNQESQKNMLSISDLSRIYQKQSDMQTNELGIQGEEQAQRSKLEQAHNVTVNQLQQNHDEAMNKMKEDLNTQLLDHESTINKMRADLGQQIQIIESEFKKKNAFLESEFNNRLTQLKDEKNQEIEELNKELADKKTELKDKQNNKRQFEQQKLEIAQLTAERDAYINKITEIIQQKEQLELQNHQLLNSAGQSSEEYKLKLQDQILNNKKILEQLKVLQEAKRKVDNKCMDLQTENYELEQRLSDLKPKSIDPFEDFNAEASKITELEKPRSARDIIQEMQLARSSTLGNLNEVHTSNDVSPRKRVLTTSSQLMLPTSKSQISLGSDKKKYRLNLWDKSERTDSRDIMLPVNNASIHKPVTLRKSEISIGPIISTQTQPQSLTVKKVAKVKEISNILLQRKGNDKDEYVEKAKTYSYDYINIKKCFGILEIIQNYQSLKSINEWFADIIYRLNSWTNKKKKLLVITEQNIFIFNSKTSLKRSIPLRELIKLKHSQTNNFIGLSSQAIEEEVLETFRKEEIILFLKKKMKKLGLNLRISEQTNFDKRNRLNDETYYNPNQMKKFKPHYTQTFSLAAHNRQIGYITTEAKEMFGLLDTAREFLCLLTNMGIVCFSRKEFKVSDFIPLVGSKIIVGERSPLHLRIVLCDATERTLAFHSANDKNAWYDMLNKNIKGLVEMLD